MYDADDRPVASKDANGLVSTTAFDALGNVTATHRPDRPDGADLVQRAERGHGQ